MIHELDLDQRWPFAIKYFTALTGKRPDMDGILFLIGARELGQGIRNFNKEEKQDLMHVATCTLLMPSGYFELLSHDQDGWPHFQALTPLPLLSVEEQERFLKLHIIQYLESEGLI